MKLRDISRQWPTREQKDEALDELSKKNPSAIVAAILGTALVEYELERIIRPRFKYTDDDTWESLTNESAPLGTFSRKIDFGFAFGLYSEVIRDALNTIRSIRNVFAHSKHIVSFGHDLIEKELHALTLPKSKRSALYKDFKLVKSKTGAAHCKGAYIVLCMSVGIHLTDLETRRLKSALGGARTRAKRLATKATSQANPFFGALAGLGQTHAAVLANHLQPSLLSQIFDPKNTPLGLAVFEHQPKDSKKPDSGDK